MNEILKLHLSLSFSGSLLILALLLCRPLLKNRVSKQWQYYIWLVVIARLLLPFSIPNSLVGGLFEPQTPEFKQPFAQLFTEPSQISNPTTAQPLTETAPFSTAFPVYLGIIWLGAALLLLIRKITIYQSFAKFVRAGQTPVDDLNALNQLARIETEMSIKKPLDLAVNPLLSTPLLIGLRRPCIILPKIDLTAPELEYTLRHELSHYQRHDLIYKWLVQLTICLHWFNPLVWLLGQQIEKDCELACDEAVIRSLDETGRRAYGDALLRALEYGGGYQDAAAALHLHDAAKILKERLKEIMRFKKSNKTTTIFSLLLTALFVIGAATAGAYAMPTQDKNHQRLNLLSKLPYSTNSTISRQLAAEYYENNNLTALSSIFYELDNDIQKQYLDKAYADDDIAMFAACLNRANVEDSLIEYFADKAYADRNTSFFSTLAHRMTNEQLENWLERATADNAINFRFILLFETDRDEEWDALWLEQEQKQLAEYAKLGVNKTNGKYYYQGQPVRVFIDVYANDKSFVHMQTDPQGEVDIKITRDDDGNIISLNYLTEAEVQAMFGDWEEEKNEWNNEEWNDDEWDKDWDDEKQAKRLTAKK